MKLEAFRELLAGSASLEDLRGALPARADEALLQRLALVRSFDAETYGLLVSDLPGAPPLPDVIASGEVEAFSPRDGLYRLAVRRDRPPAPAADPAVRELVERLHAHYCARGDQVEALYQRAAIAPADALVELGELFEQADDEFNLPMAQSLVLAMTERLPVLEPDAAMVIEDLRRYLVARGQWMEDYYRSARFVGPARNIAALRELLSGDTRSLLLWARGGMGKTMHLRWFIARECVPRPNAVPCARIDLDFIEARMAAHEPWLLLLDLAAQLNPQLPRGPFTELLGQYGHHRRKLELQGADADGGPPLEALRPDAIDDLRKRFRTALIDVPRVLLVLDTLEVALLPGGPERGQTDLEPLLAEFGLLSCDVPGVCVLMAGRYSLIERVPRLASLLPGVRHLELEEFAAGDLRRYLFDVRGLTRATPEEAEDLVSAVAEATGGLPLKVAMTAEVLERDPDADLEEIKRHADIVYLIERVLKRITPESLRWLVRYGAVARQLDPALIEQVLLPYVQDAIRGEGRDDPAHDAYRETGLYPRASDAPAARELWKALLAYAGRASWVSRAGGAVDAVRFHPEVLWPMRQQLLGATGSEAALRADVVRQIHRDAARYFDRRARDDAEHAARWATEAIYHRFHSGDEDAEAFWLEWITRLEGDSSSQRWVAADILGSDYLDDEEEPRAAIDGRPLISTGTLVEARYQLALAAAHRGLETGAPPGTADWLEAEDAIADVEHLQRTFGSHRIGPARLALVHAYVLLAASPPDENEELVQAALSGALSTRERLTLTLAIASALDRADRDADAAYQAAAAMADGLPDHATAISVRRRLARHRRNRDHLVGAMSALEPVSADLDVVLDAAECLQRIGLFARALHLIRAHKHFPAESHIRSLMLSARSLVSLGDSGEALSTLDRVAKLIAGTMAPQTPETLAAVARQGELRGRVLGTQLRTAEALRALAEAASYYASVPDPSATCRVNVRAAEMALVHGGDLTAARALLDHARRNLLDADSDAVVRLMLAEAKILDAEGSSAQALMSLASARRTAVMTRRPPRTQARVGLVGLALDPRHGADHLTILVAALGEVTPPIARLTLLEPLEQVREPVAAPATLCEELRSLIPSPGDAGDVDASDLARLQLLDAELSRVLGQREEAARGAAAAAAVAAGALGGPSGLLLAAAGVALRAGAQALARRAGERLEERASATEGRQSAALAIEGVLISSGDRPLTDSEREILTHALLVIEGTEDGRALVARGSERLALDARARGVDPAPYEMRAAGLYAELGDAVGFERNAARSGKPLPSARTAVGLEATLDPGTGEAVVMRPSRDVVGTIGPQVARALMELTNGTSSESASWGTLARVLAGDEPWVRLGAQLDPGEDVLLSATPPIVHALPWERPFGSGERVVRTSPSPSPRQMTIPDIQRALNAAAPEVRVRVDGVGGSETADALKIFQSSRGLPLTGEADPWTMQGLLVGSTGGSQPHVVIVAPQAEALKMSRRGHAVTGVTPGDAYARAGCSVHVVEADDAEKLGVQLLHEPTTILHLCCGLADAYGTPALNLTPAAWGTRGQMLYPAMLDGMLDGQPLRPLIVLDVPRPSAPHEALVQLLLRNAFAADLLAKNPRVSVVATGLVDPVDEADLYTGLATSLGTPLAAFGVELRGRTAARDSAVFGHDPTWLTPADR